MTVTPHLAFPYRIVNGGPVLVEQDTLDDIADCVEVILRYEQGFRPERPDFGLVDQTFRQGGASLDEIRATVTRLEPRAAATVAQDDAALAEMVAAVTVTVSPSQGSTGQ